MKKTCKSHILAYVVFSFLYLFSAMSYAAHTEVYMNPTLGIAISGPSDWFLEMRDHPSPQANLAFDNNPHLFAFFSKYDVEKRASWPNPLGSMLRVYVFPPANASAMAILNNFYNMRKSQGAFIEPPHAIIFNNRYWAVMASSTQRQGYALYHVTYITLFANGFVQIEAATTEQDYNKLRKTFDEVVSRMIFDNNKDSLLSKSMLLNVK